jgi:photosystem II stability/assembly factor-like uncharacterized protein
VWTGAVFITGNGANIFVSDDGERWRNQSCGAVTPLTGRGDRVFGAQGSALYRSDDQGFSWSLLRAADGGPGYTDAAMLPEADDPDGDPDLASPEHAP